MAVYKNRDSGTWYFQCRVNGQRTSRRGFKTKSEALKAEATLKESIICSRKVDEITEDGQIHDDYRIDYMRQHIEQMKEAVCDGVDLLGYTCWGCTDVVSASTGEVKKRYGLIFVDKYDDGTGDMSRKRKDSFYWYKKVIESNGEIL